MTDDTLASSVADFVRCNNMDWTLTLIYPAHFEDVPCQSGVNHIYEGYENYVSRQAYIIEKRNV